MILVPRRLAVFIRSFFIYNLKQLEVPSWREWRSPESHWADGRDMSFCCLQLAVSWHRGESQEPWRLDQGAPSLWRGGEAEESLVPVQGPLNLVWSPQEQLWRKTSSSSQPAAPLARRACARRDSAWDGVCCPKGTSPPSLRPAPSPPIHRFKNSFWGLFNLGSLRLAVRVAGRGRERCA